MHRVFTISEMLSEIHSWMSPPDLVVTVCVSLLWFKASVPHLWRDVELKTVLCALGSDSAPSDRYNWFFEAPPDKWKRFEIYSYYVQTLRGNQKDEPALRMAMASRPTTFRRLFPTCRSLTWDVFPDGASSDFGSLISPTLRDFCLRVHVLEVSFFHRLCDTLKTISPTLKYLRLDIALSSSIGKEKCEDLFHDLLTFFGPRLTLVQIPEVLNNEGTMLKLLEIPNLSHLTVDFTSISYFNLGVYEGGFSALESVTFKGSQASLCDGFLRRFNVNCLQELHWCLQSPLPNVDSFVLTVVEYCPQIKILDVGDSKMYLRSTEPRPVVSWQFIQPLLQCKNLHHLSLHCFQVAMNLKELEELLTSRVTWTDIELYTENPLSLHDLLLFSKHCPNLINLGAYVNGFLDPLEIKAATGIPFPHLRSLDFAYSLFAPNAAIPSAMFLFKFCEKPPTVKGWHLKFWFSASVALSELYIAHSKRTNIPMSAEVELFVKNVKASWGKLFAELDLATLLV